MSIKQSEFEQQVKDILANLYDYATLETHPLNAFFPLDPTQKKSRSEHLRALVIEAIEKLKPPNREFSEISIEWRPYLILHGRFVEGLALNTLSNKLSLSSRQLRREQGRALKAIASLLWSQIVFENIDPEKKEEVTARDNKNKKESEDWGQDFQTFEITQETLDILEVMKGITTIFQYRVKSQGVSMTLHLPKELPSIVADRVILRQILLRLFSYALAIQLGGSIKVGAELVGHHVSLWIEVETNKKKRDSLQKETHREDSSLEYVRYWSQRLQATLKETNTPSQPNEIVRLSISFPQVGQAIVLIVDDQETAIRMFQRFLRRTDLKVVGVKESNQVFDLAHELQPQVIILDVMMPTLDGWEVLQSLQASPETKDIPVIVCSVWNEPELAASLGAANFLKKPVTRQTLLDALTSLNLKTH